MEMRRLGSDGPEISVIGYGAWEAGSSSWGTDPGEIQVIEAMESGFDAGMNWVDTAELYGQGRSEEIVGKALRRHDEVLVFSKVAPAGSGLDPAGVRRAAEGSLRRLKRDVLDLYQVHWADSDVDLEKTWDAMARLVEDQLARFVGVSNFGRAEIERCEAIRHVDSLQPQFSLLHRDGIDELLPLCAENGTGVLAYGPLAYGLLTGAITSDTRFGDDDWRSGSMGVGYYQQLFAPEVLGNHLAFVDALQPLAERRKISLAQLALAWVVHQHGVTAAIAGSRSPRHAADNARAGDLSLSADDLGEIDELLAGLG